MLRRLQPLDLLSIRFSQTGLTNEAKPLETLAHTPGGGAAVGSLFSAWFPLQRRQTWVMAPRGKMQGLVAVRPRSGPTAWEIVRLAAPDPASLGNDLLEQLVQVAGEAGVDRLFLRLPETSPWCDVAHQAGFTVHTEEQLYVGSLPGVPVSSPPSLRPRETGDDLALFRLYCLTTPPTVRHALGVTFQEWQENRDVPATRRGQELVMEEEAMLVGWLRLTSWGQTREFSCMAHPYRGDLESLVRYTLGCCPSAPLVYSLVAHYQEGLARLLADLQFVGTARYLSLVRLVAARARHPCLLPAQA
ncbi:MAG: hypothetical protein HYX99_04865 [Chloroflexi bacterium]|nr:hypothetical protein [Chloroflexota bacterium]